MKFRDGEVVYYRHERKGLLGPFTVGIMSDGSIDLWWKADNLEEARQLGVEKAVIRAMEAAGLEYISEFSDQHVHDINEDGKINLVGPIVKIDVTRLVRPT